MHGKPTRTCKDVHVGHLSRECPCETSQPARSLPSDHLLLTAAALASTDAVSLSRRPVRQRTLAVLERCRLGPCKTALACPIPSLLTDLGLCLQALKASDGCHEIILTPTKIRCAQPHNQRIGPAYHAHHMAHASALVQIATPHAHIVRTRF